MYVLFLLLRQSIDYFSSIPITCLMFLISFLTEPPRRPIHDFTIKLENIQAGFKDARGAPSIKDLKH